MADRELTANERVGTFVQNKYTGATGTITYKNINGYNVNWITSNRQKMIPWSRVEEYVVIE